MIPTEFFLHLKLMVYKLYEAYLFKKFLNLLVFYIRRT